MGNDENKSLLEQPNLKPPTLSKYNDNTPDPRVSIDVLRRNARAPQNEQLV